MADFIPVELKENIYAEIVVPLVGAYSFVGRTNPHEVLWAAALLNARTDWWGTNMPSAADSRRGDLECCIKPIKPMCCKNGLIAGARADGPGAASPDTTRTQTLEKLLRDMPMSQPNAWQQWSEALAYFYLNVGPFLRYFTYTYKNGAYADFYEETVGQFRHPNSNKTGLDFSLIQEGSDGSTKATTRITATGTGFTEALLLPGPYIDFFVSPTDRRVIWFGIGTSYFQPTVTPIGGEVITYHKVALSTSLPAVDSALTTRAAIEGFGIPGIDIPVVEGTNVVAISLTATGPAPGPTGGSDFSGFVGFNPGWEWSFTDGVVATSEPAQFLIDYWRPSPAVDLADRFFIIYDTLGASWLFYYDLDGAGSFVPPVGLIPDNQVAIAITSGISAAEIQAATTGSIIDQGFLSDTTTGTKVVYTYIIPGSVIDFDEGTALIGLNYAYNDELKGSDGSTLASGITSDEEYATAWNDIKVPFEETQGNIYPYLDSRILGQGSPLARGASGGGSDCGACVRAVGIPIWSGSDGTITGQVFCKPCNKSTGAAVFRAVAYNTTNPPSNYNTPGNLFIASEGRQANLTPLSEVI